MRRPPKENKKLTSGAASFKHLGFCVGHEVQFLPKEVQEGLDAARKGKLARKSRLRVQLGTQIFPILKFWKDGFALDSALSNHLRGLVDVFDGARHEFQCLIVASRTEGDMLICDFKRATRVAGGPALDYFRNENAPVGYLPRA